MPQRGGGSGLDLSSLNKVRSGARYRDRVQRVRRILIGILVVSFAIFAIIALLAIMKEGLGRFMAILSSLNMFYVLLAILSVFAGYVMRFPKWFIYMRRLGVKIPLVKDFVIYMSMYSMDITPGRWGRGIVSYTINRLTGISFARTFPAVVADIITDSAGFAVVAIGSAILIGRFVYVSLIFVALLLGPLAFLVTKRPFLFLKWRLYRFRRLRSFLDMGHLYFESHGLLGLKSYAYSMLFTIPSMLMNGVALYFVIAGFGINLPWSMLAVVVFIYSSSFLVGMVSGIPATLGITDGLLVGSMTYLLGSYMDFGIAAAVTIVYRIVTVWFVQLFSSVALFRTMKYWG
ncbi:MAG: flippase-like domain-containing protein [Candidatus Micrarchaeota archaeon]|nr:flippase-like domain-containing protein [Candidatus Micrarchaeota archaeon]MDE1824417.1 flippase-like domain-containing protein [Candidatus Micrarchaeota archaeon]MDE1850121.1 flippase-like domain-containing protein [Candidatus Micrarchaeota archaeon]